MASIKKHPLFFAAMVVLGLAAAVQGFLIWQNKSTIDRLRQDREEGRFALDRLFSQKPYPNSDNARAAAAEVARAEGIYEAMVKSFAPGGAEAGFRAPPTVRAEAFFDLARMVEGLQSRAAAAGVSVRPDERFGFSQFANEGPEPALTPVVFRQRHIIEAVVDMVLAARPLEIVAVQRERYVLPSPDPAEPVLPDAPPPRPVPEASAASAAGDVFSIAPEVTARRPGSIETLAFRVAFRGQTASLRAFLNLIAASPMPLVVRSVEVDVAEGSGSGSGSPPARPPAPRSPFAGLGEGVTSAPEAPAETPIIAQNVSSFAVVVEYIELVAQPSSP